MVYRINTVSLLRPLTRAEMATLALQAIAYEPQNAGVSSGIDGLHSGETSVVAPQTSFDRCQGSGRNLPTARPFVVVLLRLGLIPALIASICGCSLVPRDKFTAADMNASEPLDAVQVRMWADAAPAAISRLFGPAKGAKPACDMNFLALSSGGSDGAFSAGLLKGWDDLGTRPQFDVVSGVSTGALIAPFAFLGRDYDGILQQTFGGQLSENLNGLQRPIRGLMEGGLIDAQPLRRLIERYTTADLLARIATEHRRGRRLFVVTTNLDAQRAVLWNMGAIAASGRSGARKLFQDVLLASASVPAAYPPVMIAAAANGKSFKEMHVDGGASTPIFALPEMLADASRTEASCRRKSHLWLVINNTQPPEFEITANSSLSIALRSYATLIKSETKGVVTSAFEASRRLGIDFNVAYIDQAVGYDPAAPFRPEYMGKVFALGRSEAANGSVWHKSTTEMSNLIGKEM